MTNTGTPNHHEIEELLGAYALDALGPDEARAMAAHVATCPRCRAELDAHREMAAALGNTVVPLPPTLWDRIAQNIGEQPLAPTDRRTHPLPFAAVDGSSPSRWSAELPGVGLGPRDATRRRAVPPRRRFSVAAVVGVAAAAALVAFLTVSLVQTNQRLGSAQRALADQRGTAGIEAALATPGHRLVTLRSAADNPVAQVVLLPDGRGYFVTTKMAPLPHGETYQLWALFSGRAVSLGLMGNRPGHVIFTLASGSPTQLAVTIEPAGGVARPNRLPVASASLSA